MKEICSIRLDLEPSPSSGSISGHLNGRVEARRRLLLLAQVNSEREAVTPSRALLRFRLRFPTALTGNQLLREGWSLEEKGRDT